MAISKARKEELVAQYIEMLERSNAVIFTEFRGLTNTEMTKLRRAVREAGGAYHVTKLTLLRRAMEQAGYPIPEYLSGAPLALSFCYDEIPGVAKALTEFAKENEMTVIRGGLMGDQFLTLEQIEALAELPPMEVLRAQILGLLEAPAANLVGVIQSGVAQVVNVLNAYIEQGEEGTATAEAAG